MGARNWICRLAAAASLVVAGPVWAKSPCDGVDLTLSAAEAERLSAAVVQQVHLRRAVVRRSFAYDDWRILGIDGGNGETFLFYRGDPAATRHFARWDGAGLDEESQIREWASETAPGFPWHLAKCFAWRLTADGKTAGREFNPAR